MNPHPPEFDTVRVELLQAEKRNVSTRDIVDKFKPNEIAHDTILDPDLQLNLLHIAAWTGDARTVSTDPVEKFRYEDRVNLVAAINLLERHPSNSALVIGVAGRKKTALDSVNAVLVTATLLAGLTFGAYLQPPLGTNVGDYRIKPAKFFWTYNSVSFYFAVYTVLRCLAFIMRSDERFTRAFSRGQYVALIRIQTAISLTLSVGFGIGAFVAAGFGNLPSGGRFKNLMWFCTSSGLLLVLFQLFRNLYIALSSLVTQFAEIDSSVTINSYIGGVVMLFEGPLALLVVYCIRRWHSRNTNFVPAVFSNAFTAWMNLAFLGVQIWLALAVALYSVVIVL